MKQIHIVKPGVETFAQQECSSQTQAVRRIAPGIIESETESGIDPSNLCFPFWTLDNCEELRLDHAKPRAVDSADEWFRAAISKERIDTPWPLAWLTPGENGFQPHRLREEKLIEVLRKRLSRVGKLANAETPSIDTKLSGFFIVETGSPDTILVSRSAVFHGQQRMKDNPAAPSRSFLKVEEAFAIMGRSPAEGETVADLGAAPGGWSWAASRRGAEVWAIDNGPLKKAAAEDPRIHHLMKDAYQWVPERPVDWLFCDMIDDPKLVMGNVKKWLTQKLCKNAVINFKYGHTNPVAILDMLRNGNGLGVAPTKMICRHLFHDRDEFTMMLEM